MTALADFLGPVVYNLLAWSVQAGALAVAAAGLGRLMPHPRGRLAFLQFALLLALMLPAVEPWSKPAPHGGGNVSVSMGPATVIDPSPSGFHIHWTPVYLLWIAIAGAAARLLWIATGLARLRRYRNSAVRLDHPPVPFGDGKVSWYVSETVTSPVTFGWTTASILLPARVAALPADLKEAIACHELIHVERRDWLFVLAEEILRALLWFQPFVWILLSEIQLAREQVVDAEVIRLMHDRERYLDALLAVAAYKLQSDLAPAPLFLKKRHLAARVATLLKETRMSKARICASFAGACTAAVAAAVLAIAIFPLRTAAQTPSQIAAADGPGITILDSGMPLMHRTAVLRPSGADAAEGTVIVEATLDPKGEVSDARVLSGPDELRRSVLQSVLQWHYAPPAPASVQIRVRFEHVTNPPAIVPDAVTQSSGRRDHATLRSIIIQGASPELMERVWAALPVHEGDPIIISGYRDGTPVSDAVTAIVNAARQIDQHFRASFWIAGADQAMLRLTLEPPPPAALPSPSAAQTSPPTPQRIRVGGNVQQANLISKVVPLYPPDAKEARVQGVVNLSVVIGKDGTVQNVNVISGHPLLIQAAQDAVKQWVYKPTLLNGNPVEVITQVDVNFTLSQ